MTEAGPPFVPGKDCFPILVNSRGFKLWRSHTGTDMAHETYVFLERFGKPGGGKGILISDGFCPTLTGQILYVMTDITKEKDVTDEEYMCTDRHETVD